MQQLKDKDSQLKEKYNKLCTEQSTFRPEIDEDLISEIREFLKELANNGPVVVEFVEDYHLLNTSYYQWCHYLTDRGIELGDLPSIFPKPEGQLRSLRDNVENRETMISDLPSMEAMLKAICEKEGITKEEAEKKLNEHYERSQFINLEGATYSYCCSHGINDDGIDKYETSPVLVARLRLKIKGKFITLLNQFVREVWDIGKGANTYFEEVVALLIDVFKVNAEKGFTTPQLLALVQIIAKATELSLTDDDVEQCLDILDNVGIERTPTAQG